MIWLVLYAIGAAVVFGWLLRAHVTARYSIEKVPLHIFIIFPVMWLPTLLAFALFVALLFLRWAVTWIWQRRSHR